jgi:cytochrome d ubiquinol oxidase subunit II
LLCGVAVVVGYALLGATWLIMKTAGDVQARARKLAWVFGIGTVIFIAAVSVITPFLDSVYYSRWFEWPGLLISAPVPIAVAVILLLMFRSLNVHHHEYRPFILALMLFALCFVGLGISIFPDLIPPDVTILDAATPYNSQIFMFVGAVVLLPLILGYTAYAYWVFRGKTDPDEGYH